MYKIPSALGIAQIALATNQEGTVGGIDAAISWGVGTVKTVSTANLTFAKLFCCCYCSSFVKLIAILLV
jgi:hypothetical protein